MTAFDLSNPTDLMLALAPDMLLILGSLVLLLWAAWRPDSDLHQRRVGGMSIILIVAVLAFVLWQGYLGMPASDGPIAVDSFRWLTDVILLLGALGTIALSMDYNVREGITAGESHVLVLLATSGMMLLAAARDLMIVFLGIELMSVAIYVLAGLNRRSGRSAEGALKYFLLGAFSTAFLLYGIALVYGATGSTALSDIGARIVELDLTRSPLLLIGVGLMVVGLGFKVAAVPFHMWAPDVYDGAPTPITGFMATAVKAAAFATFLRIWFEAFPALNVSWHLPLWWIAAATMVVGNLIALTQKSIKRMLAYSSIAHAGYVLVAVIVGTTAGTWAFLFYLLAYTLATVGAFGVVAAIGETGEKRLGIEDYAGLWRVRPALAIAMAVFMFALLGFPIFGGLGFLAKWFMLKAALDAPAAQTRLAVTLVLTSVVSAGYYLYVIMVMFMRPRVAGVTDPRPVGRMTMSVITVSAVLIVLFGFYPNPIIRWTQASGLVAPAGNSVRTISAPLPR